MAFNGWTFTFEILNFLVLAFVLHRLLYRPLHRAIDARRAEITKALADAEAERQQATALRTELTSGLAAVDEQRRQVLAEAHTQAATERARLLATVDQEAQERREEARQALARERRESEEALHAAMTALALDLSARLLSEVSGPDLQRQLAVRLIEVLSHLGEGEPPHLQAGVSPEAIAFVETARTLDDLTLSEISAAVAALAGQPVPLSVSLRPELLGGLRLLLEGRVWDGSLAGQLEEVRYAEPAGHA